MLAWKNGTRNDSGSVSNGRGTNVAMSKLPQRNVVCTDGGRWYRGEITGRMSSTCRRYGARSPAQPTAVNGLNGYVNVVHCWRFFTFTRQRSSPSPIQSAGGSAYGSGVTRTFGSTTACRPISPKSGSVTAATDSMINRKDSSPSGTKRYAVPF